MGIKEPTPQRPSLAGPEPQVPELVGPTTERRVKLLLIIPIFVAIGMVVWLETDLYDGLRVFVLAQSFIVAALYVRVLARAIVRANRTSRSGQSPIVSEITRGHVCLVLGILVLLYEETARVVMRVGQEHFNWRTPLLQAALWLLFLGWLWMERRRWRSGLPLPRSDLKDGPRRST
jgi:hypothetical protein